MGKYEKKCPVCGGKPRAEGRSLCAACYDHWTQTKSAFSVSFEDWRDARKRLFAERAKAEGRTKTKADELGQGYEMGGAAFSRRAEEQLDAACLATYAYNSAKIFAGWAARTVLDKARKGGSNPHPDEADKGRGTSTAHLWPKQPEYDEAEARYYALVVGQNEKFRKELDSMKAALNMAIAKRDALQSENRALLCETLRLGQELRQEHEAFCRQRDANNRLVNEAETARLSPGTACSGDKECRARWTSSLGIELAEAKTKIEALEWAIGCHKATIANYRLSNAGFNHDNGRLTKKLAEVTAERDAYADARSQQGSRIDALKEDIAALEKALGRKL